MPKTAKTKNTSARSNPLSPKDLNTSKVAKVKDKKPAPKKKSIASANESDGETGAQSANSKSPDAVAAKEPVADTNLEQPAANQNHSATKPSTSHVNYLLHIALSGTSDPMIAGIHQHSFDVRSTEGPMGFFGGKPLISLHPSTDLADTFCDPSTIKQESEYTLADILEGDEYKGKATVSYEYDHGDSWDHSITFLGRADANLRKVFELEDEMKVLCIAGEGHACAEDAGGLDGWEDLKEAFKPRKKDPDGKKEWYKTICVNGDPKGLDPWKWDLLDVNDGLVELNEEWYGSVEQKEKTKESKKRKAV